MPNTIFICCHQNMNSKSKVQKRKETKKYDDDEEGEKKEKKASICHDTVNLSIKHTHFYVRCMRKK